MSEQTRVVQWDDEVVITTDDGRDVRCHAETVEPDRVRRWVFRGADGKERIGPPWWGPITIDELRRLVNRWRTPSHGVPR